MRLCRVVVGIGLKVLFRFAKREKHGVRDNCPQLRKEHATQRVVLGVILDYTLRNADAKIRVTRPQATVRAKLKPVVFKPFFGVLFAAKIKLVLVGSRHRFL